MEDIGKLVTMYEKYKKQVAEMKKQHTIQLAPFIIMMERIEQQLDISLLEMANSGAVPKFTVAGAGVARLKFKHEPIIKAHTKVQSFVLDKGTEGFGYVTLKPTGLCVRQEENRKTKIEVAESTVEGVEIRTTRKVSVTKR